VTPEPRPARIIPEASALGGWPETACRLSPHAAAGEPEPEDRPRTTPPRRPSTTASGFVLVDKPAGWTSHDVVARLRRLVGTRKIGHAGTLDPMATGLLVCGVNRATRLLSLAGGQDKTYVARLRFGVETATEDAEGAVVAARGAAGLTLADLAVAAAACLGDSAQVPSAVSAVKVGGRRAYALVRQGQIPQLAARPIHISRLEWGEPEIHLVTLPGAAASLSGAVAPLPGVAVSLLAGPADGLDLSPSLEAAAAEVGLAPVPVPSGLAFAPSLDAAPVCVDAPAGLAADPSFKTEVPVLDIDLVVDCSAGTYIRALARDIGHAVGTGAHLIALRRTRSGALAVEDADVGAAALAEDNPVSPRPSAGILAQLMPCLVVTDEQARRIGYGQSIDLALAGPTALLDKRGDALAVYVPDGDRAKPQMVLQGADND
jgi:tRNA pseudouridine55 synthase